MFRPLTDVSFPRVSFAKFHGLLSLLLIIMAATFLEAQDGNATRQPSAPKESSREALLIYAEAAGFQNNKQFDLAAVEWAKFLERHKGDPRAIDARYNLAICQIQERKFKQAAENLDAVIQGAGLDFDRMEDAYLNLGWSQYSVALDNQADFFPIASKTFSQLLDKYPQSKFRDQALFFGAESLYLQGKFEDAVALYAELVEKHDDSDLHSDAMYALGVTMEDLRRFKDAGEIFDAFMKIYPDHELATEVKMRKAETVLQSGDFDTAEKLFAEVAAVPEYRALDHAKFRYAFCLAAKADGLADRKDEISDWEQQQAMGYRRAAEVFAEIADKMSQSPYAQDAAMAAGRSYYRAKEFPLATQWFKRVQATDNPAGPEAAHWRARILLNEGKTKEARETVAAILVKASAADHPYLVQLKLDDADAQYKEPASQKASVAAYLKIAQQHPEHRLAPKALYNATYGAMEIKEYETALTYAARFQEKYGEHALKPEVQKVIAECKLQLGQLEGAAEEYQKLVQSGDKDASKFELRRGLSLFLKKDYQDAIDVLSKVYQQADSPDQKAEAAYYLGRCYADTNRFDKAIEALQQSQSAQPAWRQTDEVRLHLARALRKADRLDEAKAMVRKLITEFPDSDVLDQAYYRWGEFSYASGDYATAIKGYTKVIDSWPESPLVPFSLYGRGWSQLRAGAQGSGQGDFERLTTEFSAHELAPQSIYGRGMAEHQNGDHQKSLASVESYLQTNPSDANEADALYLKGVCLIGLNQLPNAVATLSSLLKDAPNYAGKDKVLYELAWAYKNGKDAVKAFETFQQLTKDVPQSPLAAEAHYHVAEDLYNRKDHASAITAYIAANQLASTTDLKEKSAYKLGWAYYQSDQFAKAVEAFDRQLAENNQSNLAADAEFMRGESFFKAKKYDQAFAAYQRARKRPSKNPTMQVLTLLHGGQAAAQEKEWETSLQWLTELLSQFPKSPYAPQATYEQGWALKNLNRLAPALVAFEQVASTSRNELGARARFMIGEIKFTQKDYSAAILEFRRVMFGYGAEAAPDEIKQWQAKSGFEAGRCATVLASQERNAQRRAQLIEGAKGFFQYVVSSHPESAEAKPAQDQLRRLQPAGNNANRTTTTTGI